MATYCGFYIALFSFFSVFSRASAFTYSFGTPSECDNLPLTWSGGTAPFQLLLVPVFGTPQNISIPSSAFSNGQGSYQFQLPLAKDSQFVLTMSDATGFNAGGTSNILTVQASTSGSSCNTTNPSIAFSFELNTALQQCRPFTFNGYDGAIQPVTIAAFIPGGSVFVLTPPKGSTTFDWNANVVRGTSMIFMMTDAQGRPGGSSDVRTVGFSDDSTCLTNNSPSSTTNPPSPPSTTASSGSNSTSTGQPTASPVSGGVSIAAIAGTVIGSLLFLAVVITLGLFFLRRKRDAAQDSNGGSPYARHSRRYGSGALDLNHDPSQAPGVPPYGMQPPYGNSYSNLHPSGSATALAAAASNPFLDSPHSSQHQASGTRLQTPGSQHETSTYSRSSRYPSEADQYEMPQQQYGAYQQSTQLYPPAPQNYHSANGPPTIDPFNMSAPPIMPGTEVEPFTMQQSSSNSGGSMSTAQRKAAMAGMSTYKPSRFIVHTDVEDEFPPPNEDGVVELPPQYSERRAPLAVSNPNAPPNHGLYASHPPGDPFSQHP